MGDKDIKKVFALLYDIKKRIKNIEETINEENDQEKYCRRSRSEHSGEPLHGEGPSGIKTEQA